MTDDHASAAPSDAPRPGPIRFFGTTWAQPGAAYRLRRAGVAIGSLVVAAAGVLLLWYAVSGVLLSGTGGFIGLLLIAAVVVCSGLAALRTWKILVHGRTELTGWMADEKALNPIVIVGFEGALVAYFVRSLIEAPGETRERARYEAATAEYQRRRNARSGRPDVRSKPAKRRTSR